MASHGWLRNFFHGSSSSKHNNDKEDLHQLRSLLRDLPDDADEQLIHFFRSKFPSPNQSTNQIPAIQGQPGTKPNFLERAKPLVRTLGNMALDKDLTKIASETLKIVGASSSVLCALVFVGVALDRILAVNPNEEKCLKLLAIMGTIVISLNDMRKYFHKDKQYVLKNALQVVLENCVLCCDYLEGSTISKIWNSKSIEGQILEAQQMLDTILASVNCAGIVELQQLLMELQQSINYYAVSIDNILETESPVGLKVQIEKVCELLSLNEKHMQAVAVIISGLGGMGKTTLASASIEKLAPLITDFKFSRVIFDNTVDMKLGRLSDIKILQQQLVNNLTGSKQEFGNTVDGRSKLKQVLQNTSSFIFIDNVNFIDDVEELLPKSLLLNQGKNLRILITSRDRDVRVKVPRICRVKEYPIQPLCSEDAKELLYRTVMDSFDCQDQGQEQFPGEVQMLEEVKKLCCGIPIILHLIGTHLRDDRRLECYNQIIEELKKGDLFSYSSHHESVPDILLFVYKKMKVDLQNTFLDICSSLGKLLFFTGHASAWEILGLKFGENALESLLKKGIVQKKKTELVPENDEEVIIHDILKTMISNETNKYSICSSYDNKKGMKGIEKYVEYTYSKIDGEDLDLLHASLRILRIFRCSYGTNRCQATFVELRALSVSDSALPCTSLEGFSNLTTLELYHCSDLKELPYGICSLRCLRLLTLHRCFELLSFPSDLRSLTSLKMMTISCCLKLKASLDGTNMPQHLKFLEIGSCYNMGFPKDLANLTSLEDCSLVGLSTEEDDDVVVPFNFPSTSSLKWLSLKGEKPLRTLQGDFDKLQNLEELNLSSKYLTQLPVEICQYGTNLKKLHLQDCFELNSLPDEISLLTKLHTLDFSSCSQVKVLPATFQHLKNLSTLRASGMTDFTPQLCSCLVNLEELELRNCSEEMENLPDNMRMLFKLKTLELKNCPGLKNLPQSISMLSALQTLKLEDCPQLNSLPEDIGMLSNLKELSCDNIKVKAVPQGFTNLRSLRRLQLSKCAMLMEDAMDIILQLENLKNLIITDSNALIRRWRYLQRSQGIPQSNEIHIYD